MGVVEEEILGGQAFIFFKICKGSTDMHSQMKTANVVEQGVRLSLSSSSSPSQLEQALAAFYVRCSKCCSYFF